MRPSPRPVATNVAVAVVAFGLGLGSAHAASLRGADGQGPLPGPPSSRYSASGAQQSVRPVAGRLVVQNVYFPKVGREDEVLETRLRASAIRARLGLARGRVLKHVEGPDDAPYLMYLMWEAEYESAEARLADVAALEGTDFGRVSEHMGTLLDRFERTVWEIVEND